MPAFERWSNSKLTNFCSNMKVKWFEKDSLVVRRNDEILDLMIVREGMLRIDMTVNFETNNYWPARNRPRIGSK